MPRLLKGLLRLLVVVVPLAAMLLGGAVLWMSRSLAPDGGEISIAGLSEPVSLQRDDHGVPHIHARSRNDAFAALGFAHAQDRLWQMEVSRMAGQGRLSEMFGAATLETDIWLRTIAIYEAARRSYADFPAEHKAALEAYARGVNSWLTRENRPFAARLPPEFVILRHEPEPWRPEDSVVVVKMMSVGLAENVGEEVQRLAFARHGLSSDEIADLLPPLATDAPPPLPDLVGLLGLETGERPTGQDEAEQAGLTSDLQGLTERGASNNWVVSGSRTSTGAPILANDPHLGLGAPSIWYLAHLRVDDPGDDTVMANSLVGATLAGAPLVLLGRSDHVAWGFTNTASDVQDLFVEQIDRADAGRYRTPDGSAQFGSAEELIRVKGAEDHRFTRRWTRHGPVMPDFYRGLGDLLPEGTIAALQWVALAEDDTTMVSGLRLWDVTTVEEFQEAMRDYVTPMQSMVVADTAGSIGLIAPGRLPVRHPDNDVLGRAPVPGWDARYDWQGVVPFEELPRRIDPPRGAIGTANTKIVPPDYPHFLTFDWDEPYRQRRLDQLVIDAEGLHGLDTSRQVQADIYSPMFAEVLPLMIAAADQALDGDAADDRAAVLSALAAWDHRMARDASEPLIAMAWLRQSMRAIFADDLGPSFETWFKARGQVLFNLLTGRSRRNWCGGEPSAGEPPDGPVCGTILADALDATLADLDARYGASRTDWRWGAAHMARGRHRPFSEVAPLNRLFDVEIESGGGPFTLDRGVTRLASDADPYGSTNAASFRAIYDLSDLDNSTFMITTGQSGNVFSRHYRDLSRPWSDVEGIRIPSSVDMSGDAVWQLRP